MWLGKASSEGALDRAVDVAFSGDGDFLGSPFSRAFGIGYYDAGLMEARYFERPPGSLPALLEGVSYADKVQPRVLASGAGLHGDENCIVLMYDQHHDAPDAWAGQGIELRFIAAVSYE